MEEVRGEGTLWSLPQVGRRRAAGGNAARKLTAVADSVRNFLPLGRAQVRARGTLSPFWRDFAAWAGRGEWKWSPESDTETGGRLLESD